MDAGDVNAILEIESRVPVVCGFLLLFTPFACPYITQRL